MILCVYRRGRNQRKNAVNKTDLKFNHSIKIKMNSLTIDIIYNMLPYERLMELTAKILKNTYKVSSDSFSPFIVIAANDEEIYDKLVTDEIFMLDFINNNVVKTQIVYVNGLKQKLYPILDVYPKTLNGIMALIRDDPDVKAIYKNILKMERVDGSFTVEEIGTMRVI